MPLYLTLAALLQPLNYHHPKMPRKRLPIFYKALNLLRISVLNIHKLRKPIIPKLLLLKKLRKRKEFKLLRDSNHGFLGEHQFSFSPSSTPLIHNYHRNQFKNNRGYREYLCSFLYLYWCLGNLKVEGGGSGGECQLETLSSMPAIEEDNIAGEDLFEAFDSGDKDDSVDQRAERFIERFYQEMRMQRQESF